MTTIKRALISVSNKDNIVDLAKKLSDLNIEIISTGGTASILKENGIELKEVHEITSFPEIMDGRVKTLHPKIHGGILAKRDEKSHQAAMQEHDIEAIDLVIINLYPFLNTLQKTEDVDTIIENIDIGGPAMIRASAKNHQYVTIITNPQDYDELIAELEINYKTTTLEFRKKCATKAFAHTASYDSLISNWFYKQQDEILPEIINVTAQRKQILRYGENAHQKAAFYQYFIPKSHNSITNSKQIQGKELSYNNINDANAALELVLDFNEPTVAIIKHTNPCGVASDHDVSIAYDKAFNADSLSAFGGIVAINRTIDEELASKMVKIFYEVIIAPEFTKEAKEIFVQKSNLRLLEIGQIVENNISQTMFLSVTDGMLIQTKDNIVENQDNLKFVTHNKSEQKQIEDMLFAMKVCKHVKSNAIVIVKDKTTLGVGAGQMSRVVSVRNACQKAIDMKQSLQNASLASDAFFPFADSIDLVQEYGISAIIQPGGSIKDQEVIDAADKYNISMAFTGIRHFKH